MPSCALASPTAEDPSPASPLAVLLAVAGACAGDDDGGGEPPASSPTTTAATATTGPAAPGSSVVAAPGPEDDEAAVLAAVDCYWDTIVEANDPPDPDHPGFDRCFTGAALERSRGNVEERRLLGQRLIDPSGSVQRTTPQVTMSDGSAVVSQCTVDDGVLVDAPTGQTLNDRVASGRVELLLRLENGQWRVAESRLTTKSDGTSACDAPLS